MHNEKEIVAVNKKIIAIIKSKVPISVEKMPYGHGYTYEEVISYIQDPKYVKNFRPVPELDKFAKEIAEEVREEINIKVNKGFFTLEEMTSYMEECV